MDVIARDGQRLHVRVMGRGTPVLLLHGLGMDSRHWLPYIWPYLRRHRFHMPDFRGAGGSAGVRLNQRDVFQNHMEDVQDIIRHCGLQDFLLVGYSLGASTALHLQRAGDFGGVRRYLHIDQSPCVGNREDWPHGLWGARQGEIFTTLRRLGELLERHAEAERLADLPPAARAQTAATLVEMMSAILESPRLRPLLQLATRSERLLQRLMPMSHLGDLRAYLASYASGGHDYRPTLTASAVPVTFLVGMRSALYPAEGQIAIAGRVPNSRVLRFEKSGHAPLRDEPLRFVRELGRFLRD